MSRGAGRIAAFCAAAGTAPLLAACGGTSGGMSGGASASCVAPYIDTQPADSHAAHPPPAATVRPGASLVIYGHWYTSTCNDTGQERPLVPLSPVRLTLTLPDGSTRDLGTFAPHGDDMGFTTTVVVRADEPSGAATVTDDLAGRYRFRIDGG